MNKNNVIKIFVLSFCIIFGLSFVSCSKNNDIATKETTNNIYISSETTEKSVLNENSKEINQEFDKLRENLSLKYPVLTTLNISEYLDLVEKECDKMVENKKIQSFERIDNSIYIQIDDNSAYLFMPQLADEN